MRINFTDLSAWLSPALKSECGVHRKLESERDWDLGLEAARKAEHAVVTFYLPELDSNPRALVAGRSIPEWLRMANEMDDVSYVGVI